mmetsp:Transcript_57580/g.79102  ORF Transcript_57580/g.79102 Transcript_57580/m.79102 type:complete len:85 (+) Transcript_57580:643-897(+)
MHYGLSPSEFQQIKVITYRDHFSDYGIVRCSICFNNFKKADRLKQFPNCNHIFHIRCLELWVNIEAKCPNCLDFFAGTEPTRDT